MSEKKTIRKILKTVGIVIGVLLLLDFLIVGALFIPSVQTFVVHKITQNLSQKWGTELSIGSVHITPSLNLTANEVAIKDHHNENMIYSKKVIGRLWSVDTKPFKLGLRNVVFDEPDIVLRTYKDEELLNISRWAKVFATPEKSSGFVLTSNSVQINNGRFVLINDNNRVVYDKIGCPPIDYSFLELANLNVKASDFDLVNDDVAMKIEELSLKQYAGFDLHDLSADFRINGQNLILNNLKVKTEDSDLDLDLKFSYDEWTTYAAFLDSVKIDANIRPSILSMDDVADFAPAIRGMNQIFAINEATFSGVVNDFNISNIDLNWLAKNKIHGDVTIKNVADFQNVVFDVKLDSATLNAPDVSLFSLPKGKNIKLPSVVNKLGKTNIAGKFKGNLTDFNADLYTNSNFGDLSAIIETNSDNDNISFDANLKSKNLNLARLTNNGKLFGNCNVDVVIDGNIPSTKIDKNSLKKANVNLDATVNRFPFLGYVFKNITLNGNFHDMVMDASLDSKDDNFLANVIAQLDLSNPTPFLQGNASVEKFAAGNIASQLPLVDSTKAKGFDKLLMNLQRNPKTELSFDNFQIAVNGTNINDFNGFLGCDNIKIDYDDDVVRNERLRLTAINSDKVHKYIIASNLANIAFETSYPINSVVDTLKNVAHKLLPTLIDGAPLTSILNEENLEKGYVKLNLRTYNVRPLTKLLIPDLMIAPNSVVNLAVSSDHEHDMAEVNLPFFGLRNKFRLYNFNANLESNGIDILDLSLSGDSVIVKVGKDNLVFDKIKLNADEHDDNINYNLSWHNPFNSETSVSKLIGKAKVISKDEYLLSFSPSKIFLKDYECHFNDSNSIHIQPHKFSFDNLEFSTFNSSVALNGVYDTKNDSRLTMAVKNMDVSLLNPLLKDVSFDGHLSANLNLHNRNQERLLLGKAVVEEFIMNESRLGDMFLVAGVSDENKLRFSGGLFNSNEVLDYDILSRYTMKSFQDEQDVIANISGTFEDNIFRAKAIFDTLRADFLSPFLSGFSDKLTGTASGDLDFVISPDSLYFDGVVHVVDAKLGIEALGTEYIVKDQDIHFDKRGLSFKNMHFSDVDGNMATLSGDVFHNKFKDMQIDLKVDADRIKAINLPHTTNAFFYGVGYVGGEVLITGNSSKLSFVGPDIKTQKGSRIVLQVSSSNSVSETNLIHFNVKDSGNEMSVVQNAASSSDLDFDFTFDVTNDADVVLILESLGGTMNARADGRLQLLYDSRNNDLNLFGNLLLHSGDFKISLFNAVNSKFTLVPGGNINFDGPLDNMTVNLSAYKTSKTSLTNIVSPEYLNNSNVNVNAGLRLNGYLMQKIEPTFTFELPNSSDEVRNLFYSAIDTDNIENMTKQFAYFLITNSFMPENMFSGIGSGGGSSISGLGIFSNIVNNMLNNVIDSKLGSVGITYNKATEYSSAEYGLKANANLFQDRMTMSTSIGYYDDRKNTNAYNNIYGNFSVEYNINKTGTWRVKAYTYIGERDDIYYYDPSYNNYTAGVALAYKQDFDHKKPKKKKKSKTSEN